MVYRETMLEYDFEIREIQLCKQIQMLWLCDECASKFEASVFHASHECKYRNGNKNIRTPE